MVTEMLVDRLGRDQSLFHWSNSNLALYGHDLKVSSTQIGSGGGVFCETQYIYHCPNLVATWTYY